MAIMRNFITLAWKDRSLRRQTNRASIHPVSSPTSGSSPDGQDVGSKSWHSSLDRIPSWPEEARPLKERNWISNLYLVGDVILVLAPIFFFLLGIAVVTLHRKPIEGNSFGSKVEFATQLSPTIFPIVFAAIIGRSLKMIARYYAEKGAKLSTLELLMASQSVWGTVESQFLMRRLTVVGSHLLILWSLSPLGGQASLRLLDKVDSAQLANTKLRYLTTGPAGTVFGLGTVYEGGQGFRDINSLYGAALLAPNTIKTGPQDTWGNVKIPSLEAINTSDPDVDGWFTVPPITAPESYSSLIGLPVVGRPLDADANFSLESTYLSVQCDPFVKVDGLQSYTPSWFSPIDNTSLFDSTSFFLDTDRPGFLGREPGDPEQVVLSQRWDGFVGFVNKSTQNDPLVIDMRKIIMGSLMTTTSTINLVNCSLSQTHVEAMVNCTKSQCGVEKIRKSLTDTRPSALTGLDFYNIMSLYLGTLPRTVSQGVGSTPTERFLYSSLDPVFSQLSGNLDDSLVAELTVDLSLVPSDVFSRRLSLILSTYYQLSVAPAGYTGDLPQNLSLYGPDTLPVSDVGKYLPSNMSVSNSSFFDWVPVFAVQLSKKPVGAPFIGATTNATVIHRQQIFVCNFGWLALLFTASGAIFITGLASLLLKRQTLAPELFGFVASMTYENPYVRLPEGGNVLDAMERARLLKDMKVRIADVRVDDDVGHVAFTAEGKCRKLERGRLYI